MRTSSRLLKNKLMEIAEPQGGYFNSKQAISAGYSNPSHIYHVEVGDWLRVDRGIFRLAHYPSIYPREDLIILSLWSGDRTGRPQGTFSHQTALDLLGGTDIMPPKVHMTVPLNFRRAVIPQVLVLHKEKLEENDVQFNEGIRLTTPRKTLADLYEADSIDRAMWLQAYNFLFGKAPSESDEWFRALLEKRNRLVHGRKSNSG